MGLGINIAGETFEDFGNGRYVSSTVLFRGPRREFKVTPGRPSKNKTANVIQTNASISFLAEKDIIVVPTNTSSRRILSLSLQFQVQDGWEVDEVDTSVGLFSELITSEFLNKFLGGAS